MEMEYENSSLSIRSISNNVKNSNFSDIYEEEASHSMFFSTYSPESPAFSNYVSDFGISYGWLKFSLQGIGINLCAVLGVVGNILSVIVLSSNRMKSSTSCLLLYLAICDIVTLLMASVFLGIPSLLTYYPTEEKPFNLNKNLVAYGNIVPSSELFVIFLVAFSGSAFFTIALTIERYLAVCKPFVARTWCTWERANRVSIAIILFSIIFNFPRWWDHYYFSERINEDLVLIRPVPTPFRVNKIYDAWIHLSYMIFQFLAPILLLIAFNILIFREMRKRNLLWKSMSASQKQEISLTRMLFGVVAVFLICNIFPAIYIGYRGVTDSRKYVPEPELILTFTVMVNSSVNFLIYCATGTKFRQVFCTIFSTRRYKCLRINWSVITPNNSVIESSDSKL